MSGGLRSRLSCGRCLRALAAGSVAAVLASSALAQPKADTGRNMVRGADGAAGMVVTGDQEAPLVLYIVPWQEQATRQQLPEAPTVQLVPQVLDHERSLADEPLSKALPASPVSSGKR